MHSGALKSHLQLATGDTPISISAGAPCTLTGVISKLATLECLVTDLHAAFFGAEHHLAYYDPDDSGSVMPTDQEKHQQAIQLLQADAPEFVPAGARTVTGTENIQDSEMPESSNLRNWVPLSCDIFTRRDTKLFQEVSDEAATVLQHWYRSWANKHFDDNYSVEVASSFSDDSAEEDSGDDTENNAENLAVRRAFMTSICDTPIPLGDPAGDTEWSGEQLLNAIGEAVDLAMQAGSPEYKMVVLWHRWAQISEHVRPAQHKSIIRHLDSKMRSRGFPTLRDLMGLNPLPTA